MGHKDLATKVKICGLTNLGDAELAARLGAWAVGMIFYEPSPRRCSFDEAALITAALKRDKVELCGVFVNESIDEIARVSNELGLSMIQLHGDEGPSFCAEVTRRTGANIIRAVQVSGPGDVRDVERYHVDYHLLDARPRAAERRDLRGGTGEMFDWGLLAARSSKVPLILSGGINPENAREGIAAVHPFAIDSASGTESSPGHKDPDKVAALLAAAGASAAPDAAQQPSAIGEPA